MKTTFNFLCAVCLVCAAAIPGLRADSPIEGTWRWRFVMPDGTVSNPTVRLALDEGQLTGTSSFRPGSETPITNAVVRGNEVRFQVIRNRDGQDIVTTYTGKWSGKTIRGKIESNWAGEPQTYEWEAEKAQGPEGSWKWSTTVGDRKFEAQATLRQNGSKLEGTLRGGGRSRQATRIKNGSINESGEIHFEVESGTPENRRIVKYSGTLVVDTIKGTIETSVGETVRKSDWVAQRANY